MKSEYIMVYVGVLISLWLFLFAAQAKEFFLDGLKKLEQRSHKCVELGGICKYIFFSSIAFFYKAKDLLAPPSNRTHRIMVRL
jgi:hypothetical protein